MLLDEIADQEFWLVVGAEPGAALVEASRAVALVERARRLDPGLHRSLLRLLDGFTGCWMGREPHHELERALLGGQLSVVVRNRRRPAISQVPDEESVVALSRLAQEATEPATEGPAALEPEPAAPITWFEAQLVDGWGNPLSGVEVEIICEGESERLMTDSDGRARLDGVAAHSATAWVHPTESLRHALENVHREPNEAPLLEPSSELQVAYDRDDLVGPLMLGRESPQVLSIQPFVVLGRLTGMLFDTNRSFLLPVSLESIAELRALYERCTPCQLLVVGHTDTSGQAAYNEALSLERARSVLEYLKDDVDAWLARFDSNPPAGGRWGAVEDLHMIRALADSHTRPPGLDPVRWFQSSRGLTEDGVAGPHTRRALISEYMGRDGTSLPPDATGEAHGCGEAFPLDAQGEDLDTAPVDGDDDPLDRRVELFLFGGALGVQPPAEGATSGVGSSAYRAWRRRAKEIHQRVFGPKSLEIVLKDEHGQPVPHARYEVRLPAGAVVDGELDDQGFARLERLPEGVCRVNFPELGRGFITDTVSGLG